MGQKNLHVVKQNNADKQIWEFSISPADGTMEN